MNSHAVHTQKDQQDSLRISTPTGLVERTKQVASNYQSATHGTCANRIEMTDSLLA